MTAEQFTALIVPLMKVKGFRKSGRTWRHARAESIAVLNVQKSPWGGDRFYVNVGVYFPKLGGKLSPSESDCHVQTRVEVGEAEAVVTQALEWFAARETLAAAAQLANADAKRGFVLKEVRSAVAT